MANTQILPRWVRWTRAIRAALSIIILFLVASSLSIIPMQQASFNVFVTVETLLVTMITIGVECASPMTYHKKSTLVLESLTLIFWLAGFASIGALAVNVDTCLDEMDRKASKGIPSMCVVMNSYTGGRQRGPTWDMVTGRRFYDLLAGSAGLGALCFILSSAILAACLAALKRTSPTAGNAAKYDSIQMQNSDPAGEQAC